MKLSDLANLAIFLAWQQQDDGGRKVKAPYRVWEGPPQLARVNDPGHRGTLAQAEGVAVRLPKPLGMGGVGIVLGVEVCDGEVLIGIDLDTCLTMDGTADWAMKVIDRFRSFTEVSPSGTGWKVLARIRADALAQVGLERCV